MNSEEILLLIKAGYSKADIEAMNTIEKPIPVPEPKKDETITLSQEQLAQLISSNSKGTEVEEENKKVTPEDAAQSTTLSDEQFNKLLQGIRASGASIDVPEKVTLDDKLADHFASLFGASANK